MQKTAQKRSLINKLREFTDIGGKAAETDWVLNPVYDSELKKTMDDLREKTDDPIRAIVSGEQIDTAPAPDDGLSLKAVLKNAQSAINRRQYMVAAANIGKFHRKVELINDILVLFKGNLDKIHTQFKRAPLSESDLKELQETRARIKKIKELNKKANIFADWYHNITTDQGKALAFWEKRYPNKVKSLKTDTDNLLKASESLLKTIISTMGTLGKYRANRQPDLYIEESRKITSSFSKYNNVFDAYADKHMDFLEKMEQETPKEVKQDISKTMPGSTSIPGNGPGTVPAKPLTVNYPNAPVGAAPIPPTVHDSTLQKAPPSNPQVTSIDPKTQIMPSGPITKIPSGKDPGVAKEPETSRDASPPIDSENGPVTMRSNTHKEFYDSLQSLANAPSYVLSAYICKYAKSIQSTDTDTAIKLFKIANSLNK